MANKSNKEMTKSFNRYMVEKDNMQMRLTIETEKGSTASFHKGFDNERRNGTRIRHGQAIDLHTVRAMTGDKWDDRLKIDGHFYNIEIKAVPDAQYAYGDTAAKAWANFEKMVNDQKLIFEIRYTYVEGDSSIIMFKAVEFFEYLRRYNEKKGLAVWFVYNKPATTNKRGGQIQMQRLKLSNKRRLWFEAMIDDIGYDADTVRQIRSFED